MTGLSTRMSAGSWRLAGLCAASATLQTWTGVADTNAGVVTAGKGLLACFSA